MTSPRPSAVRSSPDQLPRRSRSTDEAARRNEPTTFDTPRDRLYVPLTVSLLYLGGTFALFLVVGQVTEVPNLFNLTAFVALTLAALTIGYRARARRYLRAGQLDVPPVTHEETRSARRWVAVSAAYYALYGLALLLEYGATGISDIVNSITAPGGAYFAKFQVYEQQISTGDKNTAIQLLTLLSVISAPLVPLAVVYWRRLSRGVRTLALLGTAVYASFFLFIGTLKGLGDLLIFAVSGFAVLAFGYWTPKSRERPRKRAVIGATILFTTVFVGYMAFNQSQRLEVGGIASRFEPNPVIASLTGEEFARGVAVVAFYPTHGYLGLAYNLESPFEWSGLRGSSRALDGYWVQYVGGDSAFESTYPARTEARTGWPALMYWSTAYPWFASDLSFPGTILLMGIAGWFLCQVWVQAAFQRDRLALLLFAQLMLFLVYIPANNQIGTSRNSLITFICLVALYAWNRLTSLRQIS